MNRLATFLNKHARLALGCVCLAGLALAALVWVADVQWRGGERLSRLQAGVDRSAVEVAAATLNGDLMGSLVLLGIMDRDIKQDVTDGLLSIDAAIDSTLGIVGGTFDARGVFVVSSDGVIKTSWDSTGKPVTGVNVRFRPYYLMALEGKTSVYAAVGTASGERTLFYAAPVYAYAARSSNGIGAVVAQGKVEWLDKLLGSQAGAAALLSPQGVVFAASRSEWVGWLEGAASAERIKAIREAKQFGKWLDAPEPGKLPFVAAAGTQHVKGVPHAIATAEVNWGDPAGPWKLVFLEDLTQTVSVGSTLVRVGAVVVLYGLLAWLCLRLISGHHRQNVITGQLALLVDGQNLQLSFRDQLALALVRLQQSQNVPTLAQSFLSDAHGLFGTLQGVVYVLEAGATKQFVLRGSFACTDQPPPTLKAGEGMLGQCAVERVPRVLAEGQRGWGTIRSGLGSTAPRCVVCFPLLAGDTVLGLVEVASLTEPDAFPMGTFSELANSLALNLQILLKAEQTQISLLEIEHIRQLGVEQLQLQQRLIDALPYPVFFKDANACFTGFNRAYEVTFAVNRDGLLGKSVMDLDYLPLEDRQAYDAEDRHVILTGGTVSRLMDIPFADGKVHKTLYFVVGFARADGTPGGLVGTFTDLSLVDTLLAQGRLADAHGEPS